MTTLRFVNKEVLTEVASHLPGTDYRIFNTQIAIPADEVKSIIARFSSQKGFVMEKLHIGKIVGVNFKLKEDVKVHVDTGTEATNVVTGTRQYNSYSNKPLTFPHFFHGKNVPANTTPVVIFSEWVKNYAWVFLCNDISTKYYVKKADIENITFEPVTGMHYLNGTDLQVAPVYQLPKLYEAYKNGKTININPPPSQKSLTKHKKLKSKLPPYEEILAKYLFFNFDSEIHVVVDFSDSNYNLIRTGLAILPGIDVTESHNGFILTSTNQNHVTANVKVFLPRLEIWRLLSQLLDVEIYYCNESKHDITLHIFGAEQTALEISRMIIDFIMKSPRHADLNISAITPFKFSISHRGQENTLQESLYEMVQTVILALQQRFIAAKEPVHLPPLNIAELAPIVPYTSSNTNNNNQVPNEGRQEEYNDEVREILPTKNIIDPIEDDDDYLFEDGGQINETALKEALLIKINNDTIHIFLDDKATIDMSHTLEILQIFYHVLPLANVKNGYCLTKSESDKMSRPEEPVEEWLKRIGGDTLPIKKPLPHSKGLAFYYYGDPKDSIEVVFHRGTRTMDYKWAKFFAIYLKENRSDVVNDLSIHLKGDKFFTITFKYKDIANNQQNRPSLCDVLNDFVEFLANGWEELRKEKVHSKMSVTSLITDNAHPVYRSQQKRPASDENDNAAASKFRKTTES